MTYWRSGLVDESLGVGNAELSKYSDEDLSGDGKSLSGDDE